MTSGLGAEPLEDLVGVLRDAEWDRASAVLSELGLRARGGDRGAISALIEGLKRRPHDASQQQAAEWEYIVEALERVGMAAVDPLIAALCDRSRPDGPLTELLSSPDPLRREGAAVDRLPVDHLPRVEWIAEHDPGSIEGHPLVRDAAGRVAQELRRHLAEHEDNRTC